MCSIDLKHCCDETPGEQVRNYYRKQGYAEGFAQGYDAGNGMMMKAIQTASHLERNRERQRIIKLITTAGFETEKIISQKFLDGAIWAADTIINLIKEQNTEQETIDCPNCNEKRGCSCDWQEDERTGN